MSTMKTPLADVASTEVEAKPQGVILQVRRLSERAAAPQYKTAGAAGMDLAACLATDDATLTIGPGEIVKVPTGIAIGVPRGYEGQVRARSGLSSAHGVAPVNAPGTIDSDYRGEVLVPLINLGREAFVVTHGLRVAQLIIAPVAHAAVVEVSTLDETVRGSGGFGSTGRA